MSKQEIGEKLRLLRERTSYNAKDVSYILQNEYQLDIQYKNIYNYEKGRNSPDIHIFLALCKIYGCTDILYEFGYSTKKLSSELSYEDSLILQKYHSLSPEKKEVIHGALGITEIDVEKGDATNTTKYGTTKKVI